MVGTIAQGVAFRRSFFRKGLQIRDLKGEVRQVGSDLDGSARIVFADLDFLLAAGGLQEHEFGSAAALASADLLEPEDIAVKRNGLVEILDAVTGVEEFGNHNRMMKPET